MEHQVLFSLKGKSKNIKVSSAAIFVRPFKDGWMFDLQFYVLLNSISVISGQWEVDKERLCAMELHLWLRRFCLERGSNSIC